MDFADLVFEVGVWVVVNPLVLVSLSRFFLARNLRAISSFALLICALEMLREDGRALAKGTVFCIHFEDDHAGRHECWGIQGGTYCPEDFEESLRIDTLAITGENGLDEYSVLCRARV